MEDAVKEAAKTLDQTEKDLLTSIALKEPAYSGLELQLARFRDACMNLYFLDFQVATSKDVELRLWAAHGRVNSKFRSYLALLREKAAKKKFVERRKAEELYKGFLKSSISFYRGFIQRLAANFKDVPEIFNIARGFGLDLLSVDRPKVVALQQKRALLRSCHAALIQLGDLSRYRETEIPKNAKKRNWGPAVGYYDLAGALVPEDGQAFNQRAVISLANNDHLRAVYYLYRALTVAKPPAPAKGNLELEFKKVRARHARKEPLLVVGSDSLDPEIETLYLTFHARCYGDNGFNNYHSEATRIVTGVAQILKEKPYDSAAKKMCLINIAASHHAEMRAREAVQTDSGQAMRLFHAYAKLQDLNILTFIMLLQLLTKELRPIVAEGVGEMDQASCTARVTPACRRLLPLLRLYSTWLLTKAGFLLESQNETQHQDLPQLWDGYASTLNLLLQSFPTKELPNASYLLEEDHDTAAFTAYSEKAKTMRLLDAAGHLKPNRLDTESIKLQHPDVEMLMRIKDIVKDAIHLCRYPDNFGCKTTPLAFSKMRFVFTGDSTNSSPNDLTAISESTISSAVIHDATIIANGTNEHIAYTGRSRTNEIENMVDDLVGLEPVAAESPGLLRPQVPVLDGSPSASRPASGRLSASELVRHVQQSSPALPPASPAMTVAQRVSLPGVFNTPFTPRPGEASGPSPRPGTSHRKNDSAGPLKSPQPTSPSEAAFQHQIAQMQQKLQNRSSPIQGFDPAVTPASYYQTPTGFNTFIRHNGSKQGNSSPWVSSANTSIRGTEVPRPVAHSSPYGAIGDTRPKSAKTPTSGQLGWNASHSKSRSGRANSR